MRTYSCEIVQTEHVQHRNLFRAIGIGCRKIIKLIEELRFPETKYSSSKRTKIDKKRASRNQKPCGYFKN